MPPLDDMGDVADRQADRALSPPTDRVVAVLELVAARDGGPVTALEASRLLALPRSTCRAILATLARAGWLERLPDRSYTIGTAMIATSAAVTARLPILRRAELELRSLVADLGAPCTFTRADREHLTQLLHHGDVARVTPGVSTGTRFPLEPPFGAAIVAHWSVDDQRQWIERTGLGEPEQRAWRSALASIRRRGVGAWRLEPHNATVREATLRLIEAISAHPTEHHLRRQVVELLALLGSRALTDAELDGNDDLPVGYLAAAAFDEDDTGYQIELHVNQADMSPTERRAAVRRLSAAASRISAASPRELRR
jgi:DNA-binding IclR family transcriptional regulator